MNKLAVIALACAIALPVAAKDQPAQGGKSAKASSGAKAQNNTDGRSAKSQGEANRATPAQPAKK
jgi:hypothetical protein